MKSSIGIYNKDIRSKSVRMFTTREAVSEFLENEVFLDQDFMNNVSETAKTTKVSYMIAYNLITNYLIDILYEIDKSITPRSTKKKINVYSYFFLQVGFMVSLKNKKMFLEKFVKPLK